MPSNAAQAAGDPIGTGGGGDARGATGSREPALRVSMMPRDTNAHGTIFGGVLLSYMDLAGGVEARHHAPRYRFVTIGMDAVEFHEPVFVGDLLSLYAETVRIGRTSIRVRVTVYANRHTDPNERVKVTQGELTYVCIDKDWQKVPIRPDPP